METLNSQEQLSERAIEAALLATDFPNGVMVARASGYGSFYDQREYEDGMAMEIDQDANIILCHVHTGVASQHWVGVVVYFGHDDDGDDTISLQLFDFSRRQGDV
ncbi:hypothetical protein VC83_06104 [Pseudogymnoascus destructans]|uniref:Uncharacterized protein n=1 Tax=Pseudogymnoascus destructans TaxID=655981 RepID=A0A177AC45_9PEZI|nr:uncharacterized protein VC83_06104 [Pseudogymnoascus destructans]OAF58754.1 hypothetical protein VC83_06104 [Pseudogymnoascus destructans]